MLIYFLIFILFLILITDDLPRSKLIPSYHYSRVKLHILEIHFSIIPIHFSLLTTLGCEDVPLGWILKYHLSLLAWVVYLLIVIHVLDLILRFLLIVFFVFFILIRCRCHSTTWFRSLQVDQHVLPLPYCLCGCTQLSSVSNSSMR